MEGEDTATVRQPTDSTQASTVSLKQQKLSLLENIIKCLGHFRLWEAWLPGGVVDRPDDIESWTILQLQQLDEIARIVKTQEGRRYLAKLLRRQTADGTLISLGQDDVQRAHEELSQKDALIRTIQTCWGIDTHLWAGYVFFGFDKDPLTWTTEVLEGLSALAQLAPTPGRHRRAMRLVEKMTRKDAHSGKKNTPRKVDLNARHIWSAHRRFQELWSDDQNHNLTPTLTHTTGGFGAPDAVEHFGAYEQPDIEKQAAADKAVFSAYQNALNRRGSGYGSPQHGPTICTFEFAEAPGLGRKTSSVGALWKGPTVEGEKRSYGNVTKKEAGISELEEHFGRPFADVLEMDRLRPEEAFYFPQSLLTSLIKFKREFPTLTLDEIRTSLVKQHKIENAKLEARGGRTFHNITTSVIKKAQEALRVERQEQEHGVPGVEPDDSVAIETGDKSQDGPVDGSST